MAGFVERIPVKSDYEAYCRWVLFTHGNRGCVDCLSCSDTRLYCRENKLGRTRQRVAFWEEWKRDMRDTVLAWLVETGQLVGSSRVPAARVRYPIAPRAVRRKAVV